MLKAKKAMSVLLSIIMIFGVFSIAASASNAVINEITFDFEIEPGMKVGDYEDYVTFITGNLEFDDDNGENAIFVYLDGEELGYDEAFEADKTYKISIYLKPSEGYEYDTSVEYVTVNGETITEIEFEEYTANEETIQYLHIDGIEVDVTESPDYEVIDTAEIIIDTDIAGVDADDYESYIEILTEGLEFEDNYGEPAVFIRNSEGELFYDAFAEGELYSVQVCLSAKEGYGFADWVSGNVNGFDEDAYIFVWEPGEEYDNAIVEYAELNFKIIVGEEYNPELNGRIINTAEITFSTNIAGMGIDAYEEYIEILTETLEFEDNYGDPAVYVYDSQGYDYSGEFKSGETYMISVFLSPKEGYVLADEITGMVNGEEVYTGVGYWEPGEEYEGVVVDFVELDFEITVDGEKEKPGFFDRIIQFFVDLYVKILLVFIIFSY